MISKLRIWKYIGSTEFALMSGAFLGGVLHPYDGPWFTWQFFTMIGLSLAWFNGHKFVSKRLGLMNPKGKWVK